MEGPGGNEQNVIGSDHAVLGVHRTASTMAEDRAARPRGKCPRNAGRRAAGDLVDFVDKHDPVLLNSVDSVLLQLFRVHQFRRFFFNQQLHGVFDFQLTRFLLLTAQVLEHGLQLAGHLFHAWRSHNFNAHRCCGKIDLNFFVIKLAFTQFLRNA